MMFLFLLLSLGVIVGLIGVASNPSPYYGAMSLVLGAGCGCGVLIVSGFSFIGLLLFLVYLGGMLVVFAYTVALASDLYPETWGNYYVFLYVCGFVFLVIVVGKIVVSWSLMEGLGVYGVREGVLYGVLSLYGSVKLLYGAGGVMLLICGWGLVLALLVVVELVRGRVRGGVRNP
uniref:NADH-ubiquinone oxidoreductase chain 6 n=1 Tax=Phelsuma laticauda TaxID=143529 RepID=K9JVR3_9SAUR|nr:NADH dehydrogenase subunit 6 [Phelsuma laticauda]